MSLPISSMEDILKALREHPEWRSKVLEELLSGPQEVELARQKILTQDLLKLPNRLEEVRVELVQAQVQLTQRLDELTQRVDQLAQAQVQLTERVDHLTERVDQLAQAQVQLTQRVDQLAHTVQELTQQVSALAFEWKRYGDKIDELDCVVLEGSVARKLKSYLYDYLSWVRLFDEDALELAGYIATKERAIDNQERKELAASDALAIGREAGTEEPTCVAVEISSVVKKDDVERAAQRAAIFLRAVRKAFEVKPSGFSRFLDTPPTKSYAMVVGRRITEEASEEANRRGVIFRRYSDGLEV
jgi:chromosome segregation ATPase